MGPFDLILFDCDGVLIDSELIACRVTAACLTEIGFPHTTADIQASSAGWPALVSSTATAQTGCGAQACCSRCTWARCHSACSASGVMAPSVVRVSSMSVNIPAMVERAAEFQ